MASGDVVGYITNVAPPDSNGATLTIVASTDTNPVLHRAWVFPDASDKFLDFFGTLDGYDGNGITVTVAWSSGTAAGSIAVSGQWWSFTDDTDALTGSGGFSTAPSITAGWGGPSTIDELCYDTIAFTNGAQIDSLADGEHFVFRLFRDGDNATYDTKSANAYVVDIIIRET